MINALAQQIKRLVYSGEIACGTPPKTNVRGCGQGPCVLAINFGTGPTTNFQKRINQQETLWS